MRKTYISARAEEIREEGGPPFPPGNWRQAWKDEALSEFDQFVQEEREYAVRDALKKRGLS